jgi:hypothetical protein
MRIDLWDNRASQIYRNIGTLPNSLAQLDPEELGARLGVLEMEGYVKTQNQTEMDGSSLPNGISAAGLTNQGKRALAGPKW